MSIIEKRAKSETKAEERLYYVEEYVFNDPYLIREILKYLEVDALKTARFLTKSSGLNRFWTDEKYVHETLQMMQGELKYGYYVCIISSAVAEVKYTRLPYERRTETLQHGILSVIQVDETGAMRRYEQTICESMRIDNSVYKEEHSSKGNTFTCTKKYSEPYGEWRIIKRPFVAYNKPLRPDIWAHYPWKPEQIRNGKLVINGKVLR